MRIKNFNKFNEAKMFDDYSELLSHLEEYLKTTYIQKPQEWKKKLKEIIESSDSYRFISYSINGLIEEIEKTKSNLENFKSDINSHIKELDEIYKVSGTLSDKDDKAYDDLDDLDTRVDNYIDSIDEYIEELKSVAKSYLDIDDTLPYLLKWDFKKYY